MFRSEAGSDGLAKSHCRAVALNPGRFARYGELFKARAPGAAVVPLK